MLRSADMLEKISGRRAVGMRTPSWDFSPNTLALEKELGLFYDSSLMADEDCYELLLHGEETGIVELPVEWVRDDAPFGNFIIDTAEHYTASAPRKGGPGLTRLPSVGLSPARPAVKHTQHVSYTPAPIKPVFATPLPGEGVWRPAGPPVDGGPPVLVTTYRPELDYPQLVAYVAWFDHARTEIGYYPGRYEPPAAAVRGPMMVPYDQRSRLLATFNGGFTYPDGNNGSADNGRTNEPLTDGNATLIGYRDGRIAIVKWAGGPDVGEDVDLPGARPGRGGRVGPADRGDARVGAPHVDLAERGPGLPDQGGQPLGGGGVPGGGGAAAATAGDAPVVAVVGEVELILLRHERKQLLGEEPDVVVAHAVVLETAIAAIERPLLRRGERAGPGLFRSGGRRRHDHRCVLRDGLAGSGFIFRRHHGDRS